MKLDTSAFTSDVSLSLSNQLAALHSDLIVTSHVEPEVDILPQTVSFSFRSPACIFPAKACFVCVIRIKMETGKFEYISSTCDNLRPFDKAKFEKHVEQPAYMPDSLYQAKLTTVVVSDLIAAIRVLFPDLTYVKPVIVTQNRTRFTGSYEVQIKGCKRCDYCRTVAHTSLHYVEAADESEAATKVGMSFPTHPFCADPQAAVARITF